MSKPNTLTIPTPGAELLIYVSAIESAVSAVLVEEQENEYSKNQVPVYFVSETLSGSKIYYSEIEKIAYAVLTAARKLKHNFQAHKIRVPTNHPLKEVLQSCRSSGRLGKWAAELSQQNINKISSLDRLHGRLDSISKSKRREKATRLDNIL